MKFQEGAAEPVDKNTVGKAGGKKTDQRRGREEGGETSKAAFTPVSSASLIGQNRPQQRRAVLRLAESCVGERSFKVDNIYNAL